MENVLKPLAKSVLISLGLISAASGTDAAIYKKMFGSGMTTLIISNEEMNEIIKIVQSLENNLNHSSDWTWIVQSLERYISC